MHTSKLCRSCCTLPLSVTLHPRLHRGGCQGGTTEALRSPISSLLLGGQVRSRAPFPMNLAPRLAVNHDIADGGGGLSKHRSRRDPTPKMSPGILGPPVSGHLEKLPAAECSSRDDADDPAHGYRRPVKEISEIVEAPPTPALSFSPGRDSILFLGRSSLPPLADLATPELKLAGLRLDVSWNSRSRMSFYTGITIRDLLKGGELGEERPIYGLPNEPKINYVSWSPDGSRLAFAVRGQFQEEGGINGLGLWVADVKTGKAVQLIGPPSLILNPIFDTFSWVDDTTLVALVVPPSRGPPPKKPLVPSGPNVQSNEEKEVVQNRTFQDLLKDKHDQDLFDYYATSELILVTLDGKTKTIGQKAVYTAIDPSPDGEYFLIATIHKPYSYIVPSGRFPKRIELWNRNGDFIREICDLPLAENIPITFNSVRQGRRSVNWRADKPSSLYWVETQDGGDAKVDISPREIVYTQSAKASDGEEPQVFYKLDLRYGYFFKNTSGFNVQALGGAEDLQSVPLGFSSS